MRLLRVAALLGLFLAVGYLLPKLGPQAPNSYQGVTASTSAAATTLPPTGTTTASKPPPGFPSMEFAPPENDVPDGDPIPIDTKYGIRYTVPGDWQFQRGGVMGWENDEESLRFGDFAEFEYDSCPEFRDGVSKASTGITGRSGVDVQTAALEVSHRTDIIFRRTPTTTPLFSTRSPSTCRSMTHRRFGTPSLHRTSCKSTTAIHQRHPSTLLQCRAFRMRPSPCSWSWPNNRQTGRSRATRSTTSLPALVERQGIEDSHGRR